MVERTAVFYRGITWGLRNEVTWGWDERAVSLVRGRGVGQGGLGWIILEFVGGFFLSKVGGSLFLF